MFKSFSDISRQHGSRGKNGRNALTFSTNIAQSKGRVQKSFNLRAPESFWNKIGMEQGDPVDISYDAETKNLVVKKVEESNYHLHRPGKTSKQLTTSGAYYPEMGMECPKTWILPFSKVEVTEGSFCVILLDKNPISFNNLLKSKGIKIT
jgi:hypothetical protein